MDRRNLLLLFLLLTLDVNVFCQGDEQCNLTLSDQDVYAIPSDSRDLIFPFTQAVNAHVLVRADASAQLTATVTCGSKNTTANVTVTSDVDLQFSWTSTPSPADQGKPLNAAVTLVNRGGHPAVGFQCEPVTAEQNPPFTLTCDQPWRLEEKTCRLDYLQPNSPATLLLGYDTIAEHTNVSVECRAHNLPQPLTTTYAILIKDDAEVQIVTPGETKAMAGSDSTVVTTIKNVGSAVADGFECDLVIEKPETTVFVSLNETKCTATVDTVKNVTTGAHCTFGDLLTNDEYWVGLTFHVGADVEESNQAAFKWNCTAEGLETVAASEIKVITEARADLALTLPANSSIEGGTQSLLFRLKNLGPSNLRGGECKFTLSKGVEAATWSQSSFFNCSHAPSSTDLQCDITNIPPTDAEFNLGLVLKDLTLKQFTVNALCDAKNPKAHLNETFTIDAGVKPSPSPAPSGVAPAPDNTMMVVVTVIVALGLLIVMIIWWRKRQDAAGWEAAGPNPRSPSLNRFSDVELSIRSSN
ncbi:uncharacterized protein ACA1_190910 [Acanthamoeba castellanii str. Neff]|uniref:Uncharacterized protein n=1 Tax=Acanthamoeba castellanii (strain ATCC 30010 / Neff) TaxID=1257118 RepID=L8GF27_ACACF|nr:uncharacterized protein ACA1_190910 [Acanthamoeba castellanii str. Neff]ELR11343.1 hypothetical protein ACA1_190910 [Acanthamoeba castellanii str. Neff]